MELHKALRHIVLTEGQDILKEIRLINILDDFNAYQDIPASKYILRAIIADGYTAKLSILGKWDSDAELLASKFSSITGFIPESVFRIFLSLAYGLDWIDEYTIHNYNSHSNTSNNNISTQQRSMRGYGSSVWRKNMTEDEKEQYILSMVEYDNSKENHFHVTLENLCFEVNDDEEITIQCEFRRTGKVPGTGYAWLHYALYDQRGRMKDTNIVSCMTNDESNPKPVIDRWWKVIAPKLSKIRLYWES